jgi:hypothetical protein
LWIVANAAVLVFLVVNPKITRSLCDAHWVDDPADWIRSVTSDEERVEDACGVETHPLAGRGAVLVVAVLANGAAFALGRARSRDQADPPPGTEVG